VALLALYTIALGIALLAPFDLRARNAATWTSGGYGVIFVSAGVVRSVAPPRRLHRDLTSGTGLTLEVWLRTNVPDQSGPARIVSYSLDTGARNFTLGQKGNDVDVRLRTNETNFNGTPSLTVPGIFTLSVPRHITVTYDFRRLCVYVDGQLKTCRASPAGGFENWDPGYYVLFGNERTADRPWLGTLFLVGLYNRALSPGEIRAAYAAVSWPRPPEPAARAGLAALWTFAEGSSHIVHDTSGVEPVDLVIPRVLQEPRCPFLSPGTRLSRINMLTVADVIGNVLIFVPFGWLCHGFLHRRGSTTLTLIATLMIIAAFAIGVESVQYLLVSRCSQREDVILNVLGGLIGALASTRRPTTRQ
jgi:hypothetical protein